MENCFWCPLWLMWPPFCINLTSPASTSRHSEYVLLRTHCNTNTQNFFFLPGGWLSSTNVPSFVTSNFSLKSPTRKSLSDNVIINQRDATDRIQFYFIFLHDHSTCFGCCPHPSSEVHETVTTASGTGHISLRSCNDIWPVPEAVVTASCTPDDGWGQHPKHVEWSCRKIK